MRVEWGGLLRKEGRNWKVGNKGRGDPEVITARTAVELCFILKALCAHIYTYIYIYKMKVKAGGGYRCAKS